LRQLSTEREVTIESLNEGAQGGEIISREHLHESGSPSECFNIVILGDGFQTSERSMFKERALVLTKALLKTRPFEHFKDKINVYAIVTDSNDSGVDDCPYRGVKKDTYYNVVGHFDEADYAGFFGSETPAKIHDAVRLVVPRHRVGVTVVLVNSAMYGGRSEFGSRTSFVPIVTDDKDFTDLAAHEMAHAIGTLADEYIGGGGPVKELTFPNVATEEQRLAHSVPWWRLASDIERSGGDFRIVHRLGDPTDEMVPVVAAGLEGMLGLYWGCAFVDPKAPSGLAKKGDPYLDARGAHFYRGMARCKMRAQADVFCRVCADALTRSIESAIRGEPSGAGL
jgi:hypothetical protein